MAGQVIDPKGEPFTTMLLNGYSTKLTFNDLLLFAQIIHL